VPVNFAAASTQAVRRAAADLTAPSDWTFCCWYRWNAAAANRNVTSFGEGSTLPIDIYFGSAEAGRIIIDRETGNETARWWVTAANMVHVGNGVKWLFLAITQVGTNTPTVYHSDPAVDSWPTSRTVTTSIAPTAAGLTPGSVRPHYGNDPSFGFALGGDLAYVSWYDVALTEGELRTVMWRGYVLRSVLDARPLWNTSLIYDLSGSGDVGALNGTPTDALGGPPTRTPSLLNRRGLTPFTVITPPTELEANVSGRGELSAEVGTADILIEGRGELSAAVSFPDGVQLQYDQQGRGEWVLGNVTHESVEVSNVVLDPFWRPGAVGNGRYRVSGEVLAPITDGTIEWQLIISGVHGSWMTTTVDLDKVGKFGFWVEPPFQQGVQYTLRLRVSAPSTGPTIIFQESFVWIWTVHDVVGRFRSLYMPDFLRESSLGNGLYTVHAKALADIYVMLEDCVFQSIPSKVTWAIADWERQLGLPSYSELRLADRRALVVARRFVLSDEARTEFVKSVGAPAGQDIGIVDTYPTYTVTIRLPAEPGDALYRAMTELVQELKPAGINVVLAAEGAFLADISAAGDPV
jgi:hypothetical protein